MTGYGFGIIGAGVIGAVHAEAIGMVPGARLVAVTDVVPERAKELAGRYGCAAEPVGTQAVAAGKHLVIEKPIDVTLDAADRLIEAARAAGVALTVISQHRFDPDLIELKRLLGDGALGRLVLGEASTKWYRSQAYYDSAGWRGTWAMDGGSLMNQGIHYVDLLRWCMGPVTEVTAICATQAHQVEVEDTALAIVRFASGALGTIVSSTAVYPGFSQRQVSTLLVDAKTGATNEVRQIARRLAEQKRRSWLVLNKIDLVPTPHLLPLTATLSALAPFEQAGADHALEPAGQQAG